MQEIFRTTDLVEIALLKSVFSAASIKFFVFDEYANSMAIFNYTPCRFMVLEDDYDQACKIIEECGLETTSDE